MIASLLVYIVFHLEIRYWNQAIGIRTRCRMWIVRMYRYVRRNIHIRYINWHQQCKVWDFRHWVIWVGRWCPWWWDIWLCRGDVLLDALLLACAVVLSKLLEHNSVYCWCWHLGHWQLSPSDCHLTAPRQSLDLPSTVSTCQTSWKMHFVVIFQMFPFWSVHSNIFSFIFFFIL